MTEMKTLTIENKTYEVVDAAARTSVENAVKKAGDIMTGALTLFGDPTDANHAATKQYVDGLLAGGAKVVTGSYVGTGKYTSSKTSTANHTQINLGFEPKLLLVNAMNTSDNYMIYTGGLDSVRTNHDPDYGWWCYISVTNGVVSWYLGNGSSADYQLNTSGATYHYVAIC